ncbi:hypothetical protein QBC35DRAFT_549903 [Podospora australis]|uniref:Uncharacterized protein n=1 Tax=Podospora australis TaxID=1536484 RepID=A0AAN6WVQ4_9PEZI|nr:hypothetical protein QBC35DRAFT_549903 [Podospora australis]
MPPKQPKPPGKTVSEVVAMHFQASNEPGYEASLPRLEDVGGNRYPPPSVMNAELAGTADATHPTADTPNNAVDANNAAYGTNNAVPPPYNNDHMAQSIDAGSGGQNPAALYGQNPNNIFGNQEASSSPGFVNGGYDQGGANSFGIVGNNMNPAMTQGPGNVFHTFDRHTSTQSSFPGQVAASSATLVSTPTKPKRKYTRKAKPAGVTPTTTSTGKRKRGKADEVTADRPVLPPPQFNPHNVASNLTQISPQPAQPVANQFTQQGVQQPGLFNNQYMQQTAQQGIPQQFNQQPNFTFNQQFAGQPFPQFNGQQSNPGQNPHQALPPHTSPVAVRNSQPDSGIDLNEFARNLNIPNEEMVRLLNRVRDAKNQKTHQLASPPQPYMQGYPDNGIPTGQSGPQLDPSQCMTLGYQTNPMQAGQMSFAPPNPQGAAITGNPGTATQSAQKAPMHQTSQASFAGGSHTAFNQHGQLLDTPTAFLAGDMASANQSSLALVEYGENPGTQSFEAEPGMNDGAMELSQADAPAFEAGPAQQHNPGLQIPVVQQSPFDLQNHVGQEYVPDLQSHIAQDLTPSHEGAMAQPAPGVRRSISRQVSSSSQPAAEVQQSIPQDSQESTMSQQSSTIKQSTSQDSQLTIFSQESATTGQSMYSQQCAISQQSPTIEHSASSQQGASSEENVPAEQIPVAQQSVAAESGTPMQQTLEVQRPLSSQLTPPDEAATTDQSASTGGVDHGSIEGPHVNLARIQESYPRGVFDCGAAKADQPLWTAESLLAHFMAEANKPNTGTALNLMSEALKAWYSEEEYNSLMQKAEQGPETKIKTVKSLLSETWNKILSAVEARQHLLLTPPDSENKSSSEGAKKLSGDGGDETDDGSLFGDGDFEADPFASDNLSQQLAVNQPTTANTSASNLLSQLTFPTPASAPVSTPIANVNNVVDSQPAHPGALTNEAPPSGSTKSGSSLQSQPKTNGLTTVSLSKNSSFRLAMPTPAAKSVSVVDITRLPSNQTAELRSQVAHALAPPTPTKAGKKPGRQMARKPQLRKALQPADKSASVAPTKVSGMPVEFSSTSAPPVQSSSSPRNSLTQSQVSNIPGAFPAAQMNAHNQSSSTPRQAPNRQSQPPTPGNMSAGSVRPSRRLCFRCKTAAIPGIREIAAANPGAALDRTIVNYCMCCSVRIAVCETQKNFEENLEKYKLCELARRRGEYGSGEFAFVRLQGNLEVQYASIGNAMDTIRRRAKLLRSLYGANYVRRNVMNYWGTWTDEFFSLQNGGKGSRSVEEVAEWYRKVRHCLVEGRHKARSLWFPNETDQNCGGHCDICNMRAEDNSAARNATRVERVPYDTQIRVRNERMNAAGRMGNASSHQVGQQVSAYTQGAPAPYQQQNVSPAQRQMLAKAQQPRIPPTQGPGQGLGHLQTPSPMRFAQLPQQQTQAQRQSPLAGQMQGITGTHIQAQTTQLMGTPAQFQSPSPVQIAQSHPQVHSQQQRQFPGQRQDAPETQNEARTQQRVGSLSQPPTSSPVRFTQFSPQNQGQHQNQYAGQRQSTRVVQHQVPTPQLMGTPMPQQPMMPMAQQQFIGQVGTSATMQQTQVGGIPQHGTHQQQQTMQMPGQQQFPAHPQTAQQAQMRGIPQHSFQQQQSMMIPGQHQLRGQQPTPQQAQMIVLARQQDLARQQALHRQTPPGPPS